MISAQVLLNNLSPYKGEKYLIKKNQNVEDIIEAIEKAHKDHRSEYKKIARKFLGKSKRETAKNIWNFLKKNVPYKEEPEHRQTIKSPAAILITGIYNTEKNDCKNYALFSAGILQGLNDLGYNIPYSFRFASYNIFDKTPGHVFVVVDPGTKKEIWIDPVLKEFDLKKQYSYAKDKKMMYSISGVSVGAPKRGRVVLKIAMAPARNAFLALVGLNFTGLADKLRKADQKTPGKLKNFWEKLGGRYQTLLNNIKKGEKKRRLLGVMGAPITAAALVTAAAPIIAAVGKYLKENGINPEQLIDLGIDKLKDAAKNLILNKKEEQDLTDENLAELEKEANNITTNGATTTTTTTGQNILPLVLIGGAAAFFLLRKKR
jgi:hypothetical protein